MNAPARAVASPAAPEIVADPSVIRLATLQALARQARQHAADRRALHALIATDTHELVPYRQALLVMLDDGAKVVAASGVPEVNRQAPFVQWLEHFVGRRGFERDALRQLSLEDVPAALQDGWKAWMAPQGAWIPLPDAMSGRLQGGLWLSLDRPLSEPEQTLLGTLGEEYGFVLARARHRRGWRWSWKMRGKRRTVSLAMVAGALAALWLPVTQTALAPAKVVPEDPRIAAAPFDGVIQAVHIKPNQAVSAGDLLFSMDDTAVRNRLSVAIESLNVAQAELHLAEQKSFADPDAKARLAVLQAQADEKSAEAAYAQELLKRAQVRADIAGVAIFGDPNDWIGRPVGTGERVLLLADPAKGEIEAYLAADDAITFRPEARVRLFLATDPTAPIEGALTRASFVAEPTPEGVVAFRIRARFEDARSSRPRIGLQGTAKIYGEPVRLYEYLLRRPIATVRRTLGL